MCAPPRWLLPGHHGRVARLLEAEIVQQDLKALAVFGEIDGVGQVPRIGTLASAQRIGELERRLSAELHDNAHQGPVARSFATISSTSSAVSGSK